MGSAERQLLTKFLDNDCTVQELQQVKALLGQPEGMQLLHELMQERDDLAAQESPSAEEELAGKIKGWEKHMHERILDRQARSAKHRLGPSRNLNLLSYAAIALLVMGIGFILYRNLSPAEKTGKRESQWAAAVEIQQVTTLRGQRTLVRLPDSSVIYLGPESTLSFAKQFNRQKTRAIELSGEAFFAVHPDRDRSFVIRSGEMETRVLGTSFKVDAFPGQPYAVKVATGKVRVSKATSDSLSEVAVLTRGQALAYEPKTALLNRNLVDSRDLAAWTEGRAVFADISLEALAHEMERWYNVDVSIGNQRIAGYRITIALSWKDPLEKSLKAIKATTGFNYSIQGRKITLHP